MNDFQNIKENASLPPEKKQEMWANITGKIAIFETSLSENVRMEDDKRHTQWGAYIMPSVLSPNHKKMVNTKIFATMLVILAGIIATAAYAAEQALPGDALYGFKVHVNESVRGAFNLKVEDKANWEIEKIERRAEEKKELEAKARMTTTAQTEIESRSQDSAEKVREVIARLQTEWRAEAATSLEGGLNTALRAITSDHKDDDNDDDSDESSDEDTEVDSESDVESALNVKLDVREENDDEENTRKWTIRLNSELKVGVDSDTDLDL